MTKKVAILICGPACSGKTTFANYLNEQIDRSVIIPMATGLKEIARLMSWDGDKDGRGRLLLQALGSVGRAYWEDLWVMRVVSEFSSKSGAYDVLIVDDVRYQNEVDVISAYFDGVMVIRIERDGAGLSGAAGNHESEQWYKGASVNGYISNNLSFEELRAGAQGVSEYLKEMVYGD